MIGLELALQMSPYSQQVVINFFATKQIHLLNNIPCVYILGHMETTNIIAAFAALAQDTRLKAFRLLVSHEPEGLAAGEIARQLDVPHNTMSAHLAVLSRANLVISQRQSRSIIYRANLEQMREAIRFLAEDCCAGHPEVCEPLLETLSTCAPN